MPYTTTAAIEAKIPAPILNDALDDNHDGLRDEGILDQIIANASLEVDAMICNRVPLPLATAPPSIAQAALLFACEEIYTRRQADLPKPLTTALETARAWLTAIRDGKQNLDAATALALNANSGGNPQIPGRIPIIGAPTTY